MSPEALQSPRILLVGNDALARRGLHLALDAEGDVVIAGDATGDDDLDRLARNLAADVLLVDLGPEGAAAFDLTPVGIPTLVLAESEQQARGSLGGAVLGAAFRDAPGDQLVAALRAVAHGLVTLDPQLASGWLADPSAEIGLLEPLTPREIEVLTLLGEGLSNRSLAARLDISPHTAKFHVNSILTKLGANSRTEAVVRAARLGLLHL